VDAKGEVSVVVVSVVSRFDFDGDSDGKCLLFLSLSKLPARTLLLL
jgi:hypothetical protein